MLPNECSVVFPMTLAFSHATSMAANDVSNSASFQHVMYKVVIVI